MHDVMTIGLPMIAILFGISGISVRRTSWKCTWIRSAAM